MSTFTAKPETYYLYRGAEITQAANGYLVTAGFPCRYYNASGEQDGERVWGKARLIWTNVQDLMEFLERYFTCSPQELDEMADRYYRHDIAQEMRER
jgi:hypothetical protein